MTAKKYTELEIECNCVLGRNAVLSMLEDDGFTSCGARGFKGMKQCDPVYRVIVVSRNKVKYLIRATSERKPNILQLCNPLLNLERILREAQDLVDPVDVPVCMSFHGEQFKYNPTIKRFDSDKTMFTLDLIEKMDSLWNCVGGGVEEVRVGNYLFENHGLVKNWLAHARAQHKQQEMGLL